MAAFFGEIVKPIFLFLNSKIFSGNGKKAVGQGPWFDISIINEDDQRAEYADHAEIAVGMDKFTDIGDNRKKFAHVHFFVMD